MSAHPFHTLSAEQHENVRLALAATFGSDSVGAVMPVTGGITTASTFRLEARGRHYLLRVEGEPSPLRNPHQYVSMRIATEAGIAPAIHYIDEAARIVVIDFVEKQPLNTYPGGSRALARALGEMFSRVQATTVFPYFVNYADIVARLFAHVRRTGLFAAGLLGAHVDRLELLREAYDVGATRLVSS